MDRDHLWGIMRGHILIQKNQRPTKKQGFGNGDEKKIQRDPFKHHITFKHPLKI